jgi:hypothetical protein
MSEQVRVVLDKAQSKANGFLMLDWWRHCVLFKYFLPMQKHTEVWRLLSYLALSRFLWYCCDAICFLNCHA